MEIQSETYVSSIFTDYWTVHANLSSFVPEPNLLPTVNFTISTLNAQLPTRPEPASEPACFQVIPKVSQTPLSLPLFGWRSTNFVKSENSSMIENGIRDAGPFEAFYKLAVVEMGRSSRRDLDISNWQKQKRSLTPHAKGMWENERARIGEYQVRRSTSTVYFASRCGSDQHRRVDITVLHVRVQLSTS